MFTFKNRVRYQSALMVMYLFPFIADEGILTYTLLCKSIRSSMLQLISTATQHQMHPPSVLRHSDWSTRYASLLCHSLKDGTLSVVGY